MVKLHLHQHEAGSKDRARLLLAFPLNRKDFVLLHRLRKGKPPLQLHTVRKGTDQRTDQDPGSGRVARKIDHFREGELTELTAILTKIRVSRNTEIDASSTPTRQRDNLCKTHLAQTLKTARIFLLIAKIITRTRTGPNSMKRSSGAMCHNTRMRAKQKMCSRQSPPMKHDLRRRLRMTGRHLASVE